MSRTWGVKVVRDGIGARQMFGSKEEIGCQICGETENRTVSVGVSFLSTPCLGLGV